MLGTQKLMAFIPTRDAAQARAFYETTLGLRVLHDDGFALILDANGTLIRVVRVGDFSAQPFTILGWQVPDIDAAVTDLTARGVQFLKIHGMEQSPTGVWTAPGGAKIAWFKDSDGNTLSVSQH